MSRPESSAAMIDAEFAPADLRATDAAERESSSNRAAPRTNSVGSSLIAQFLEDQQRLPAVERFAAWQAANTTLAKAKIYSALLPAAPPQPGEQYAFEVDLDACSGCKSCVVACHTLNGLDEGESFRDVGLLHGGSESLPVLQHVSTACHHCLDPACMNVCPVLAYEKDPATGIVRHLDDQCIGCQYCALACPYDVPKYNHDRGIVRKCDMCSERLTAGESPACAAACPNGAIKITVVSRQETIENCETHQFLPGAPDPAITLPTTHFKTRKVLPRNLHPADYYSVRPEHAHWPLVVMLVLTQLSVGSLVVSLVLRAVAAPESLAGVAHVVAASVLAWGLLALAASTFHLGRPHLAFRAVIGLRTSWLSREILAFGLFAALAAAEAIREWLSPASFGELRDWTNSIGLAAGLAGVCGVVCSIKIYQCTQRTFWNGTATSLRFLSTAAVLGIVSMLVTAVLGAALSSSLTIGGVMSAYGVTLMKLLVVVAAAKLACEAAFLRHLRDKSNTPLKRSAMLLTGPLARATVARFAFAFVGGVLLPGLLVAAASPDVARVSGGVVAAAVVIQFAACLAGEIFERYLFFTAAVAHRMPGRLRP